MYQNYPVQASKNATEGYVLNLIKGSCKNATGVKTGIKLMNREVLNEKFVKKIYSYLKRAAYKGQFLGIQRKTTNNKLNLQVF